MRPRAPRVPSAEPLRLALRDEFRLQRNACLRALGRKPRKSAEPGGADGHRLLLGRVRPRVLARPAALPAELGRKDDYDQPTPIGEPDVEAVNWPNLRVGQLGMVGRMTPLISAAWDKAGRSMFLDLDLDPDKWQVTDPNLKAMIEAATFDFAASTNAATSLSLDAALTKLRKELVAGVVRRGESIDVLAKRVAKIFDLAEKSRARSIAQTETVRAVHAAQMESGRQSGVVIGWEWLASSDACPICLQIAAESRYVRMGESFAKVGDHPTYSDVRHPPAHPGCNCSMVAVLSPDMGGPKVVPWGRTIVPTPTPPPE